MKMIASPFTLSRGSAISRVFNAVFFSAEAQSSPSPRSDTLLQRISGVGDPEIPMVPLLDQWLEEGRPIKKTELRGIIRQLRKYRRYTHALQVQQWMTEKMKYEMDPGDNAIRLDLISKRHGLEKAEEFFNSVESSSKSDKVYGAMLNCYATKRSLTKAEELFEKMKELGFVKHVLTYNVMLSLYARIGDHKKLVVLVEEMKEKNIAGDSYTSNIILNSYANTNNVEKLEKLFTEMEANSQVTVDFYGYFTAFKGYLKAGLSEKALTLLTKIEKLITMKGNRIDYEHLITLYASVSKKDDVYRVWELYKNTGRLFNTGYISMISSLLRLDDVDGAEKIFEEWEAGNTGFDIRVPNLLITAYCKKGQLEKALACVDLLTSKGKELGAFVWHCLATHCCREGQLAKAVEVVKKALSGHSRQNRRLHDYTMASCLEYLKKEGDKETALEILARVRESGTYSNEVCDRLVEFVNGDTDSGAFALMKENRKKGEKLDVPVDGQMTDET